MKTLNKNVVNAFTEKVNSATGAIAHFSGSLAALLLLVEGSPPRRRALPESRKNAHSHLSNYRF